MQKAASMKGIRSLRKQHSRESRFQKGQRQDEKDEITDINVLKKKGEKKYYASDWQTAALQSLWFEQQR